MPETSNQPAGSGRRISPEALIEVIRSVALELHPHSPAGGNLSLDSSIERDFGLDSLGRVEMLSRLERTLGICLDEQAVATAESPRDLLNAARSSGATLEGWRKPAGRHRRDESTGEPVMAETLMEVFDWHVSRHPDRLHIELYLEDGSSTGITYVDLMQSASNVAAGLLDGGLQPGERVGLMLPTGRDYLDALYGTLLAGGVPVPLYPPVRPSQLEDHLRRQAGILANARCRILISDQRARPLLKLVASGAPELHSVLTVDEIRSVHRRQLPERAAGETALLQYTSGSTGQPK
jgi:non-ribosomal peptide synthetase component F